MLQPSYAEAGMGYDPMHQVSIFSRDGTSWIKFRNYMVFLFRDNKVVHTEAQSYCF